MVPFRLAHDDRSEWKRRSASPVETHVALGCDFRTIQPIRLPDVDAVRRDSNEPRSISVSGFAPLDLFVVGTQPLGTGTRVHRFTKGAEPVIEHGRERDVWDGYLAKSRCAAAKRLSKPWTLRWKSRSLAISTTTNPCASFPPASARNRSKASVMLRENASIGPDRIEELPILYGKNNPVVQQFLAQFVPFNRSWEVPHDRQSAQLMSAIGC